MLSPQLKPARCTHAPLGYSLTELAIVLAIIGLVSGMTLSVGKVQMDIAEFQGTQERLETIRDALLLFQKKYERYPCPALPADSSTSATYGQEVTGGCAAACPAGLSCGTNAVIGMVPFKTLRVNEELAYDSWDAKIAYAVDKHQTESSIYNTGSIPIVDMHGHEVTSSPLLGDAIFVLVSHGEDGKGAYGKSGALLTACGAAGKDIENCNGDDIFMDSRFNLGDIAANYYDDLIVWQTQKNIAPQPDVHATLDLSDTHLCVIKDDQTAWCWGWNASGELGDGTTTDRYGASMAQMAGIAGATEISLAGHLTFVLKNDGTLWCAGDDFYGLCGDGPGWPGTPSARVALPGNTVQMSSLDYSHSCAVQSDGTAWCWGPNGNGQLGDGDTADTDTPVQVSQASGLTNAVWIAVGATHTCAVQSAGTAWCWGRNTYGQLGDSTTAPKTTPVQVSGLTNAKTIAASADTSCALKTDGTLWCWGRGDYGQRGDNTTTATQTAPVPVLGLTGVRQLVAGVGMFCAVRHDNTMWCWGQDAHGALGDGYAWAGDYTSTPQRYPVTEIEVGAAGGTGGGGTVCVLKTDNTLWCSGRLPVDNTTIPVKVNFYP